jgi:formate hydrogenlyase subunit 3/multisubunit Na+/H+ antiporter MnhD subunit
LAQGIILGLGILWQLVAAKDFKAYTSVVAILFSAIITSIPAIEALMGTASTTTLYGGNIFGQITFTIDALSAWFILIINLVSVFGALYGTGYLGNAHSDTSKNNLHWTMFMLFHASMLWVCMLSNGLAFVIAWEIMSLSSFMLVIYDYQNKNVLKAGINYLVQMHLSVVLLSIAFIWVYSLTGTFDFEGISSFFAHEQNIWLFLLFVAGFGLKAGFLGLHTWLPEAHPAAPSHVSGVMSGVIVKMGIYGILRVISHMQSDYLLAGQIILTLALLTGLFGIMNAAVHRDFKKMLAYCTIENMGIIGLGIGLGLIGIGLAKPLIIFLGFGGALFHVLNHSLFKSLLFFTAGSVYKQTHTRNMEHLGGLIKKMPSTGVLYLMASIAISGLPPFSGFISEFMIYLGFLSGIGHLDIGLNTLFIGSFAGLSIIGGISVLAFTKSFGIIFLGEARTSFKHPINEVPRNMLFPKFALLALMIGLIVIPALLTEVLALIIHSIASSYPVSSTLETLPYVNALSSIGLYTLLFLAVSVLIFAVKHQVTKKHAEVAGPTWGCGYTAASPKLQYTGKAYSKSLAKLFSFIVPEQKHFNEIQSTETFPEKRSFLTSYQDIFDDRLIHPLSIYLRRFTNLFQFIQNGRIQAYVFYGILFMLIVFLGTLFNLFE